MNYLERLENEISEMKDFIDLGFKRIETIGQTDGGTAATPRLTGDYPNDLPTTGEVLREAAHKTIYHIFDIYDIPFVSTMFLIEKKLLYLQFMGANRIVMYRILD